MRAAGPFLAEAARLPTADPILQSRMTRGFQWSFGATLVQGVFQIVVTMTMARLLAPADYGLYALVDVVLRWAGLLGQMGLATVLVQRATLLAEELLVARTLALALALASCAVIAGGAPLLATAFGQPALVPLLRVASLSFLLNGLGLTSLAWLRRQMQFGRLSAAELGGYIIGNGLTAIYLARHGFGVWSVLWGSLTGQLVQNLIAITQARLPFGLSLSPALARPLLRQGAHVSLNSCLDVTNNTMDTFVFARVVPAAVLGLFNRSAMLAGLPVNFLWSAVSKVTFPSYARLQQDKPTFSLFFQRTQIWSGTLSVSVPLSMIPAADIIVRFLLGPNWEAAVPILRLLLLAFAFESLAFPYHSALDALGCYNDRTRIRLGILLVRGIFLALAVGYNHRLLFAAAAVAGFSTWLVSVWPLARRLSVRPTLFFRNDALTFVRALVCAVAVGAVHIVTARAGFPAGWAVLGCAAAGALALAATLHRQIQLAWANR